jgi:hypothetical protein
MAMSDPIVNPAGEPVDGLFSADEMPDGQLLAQSIQIRSGAGHRPMVALHEIGHFIDLHGLPGPRFASADATVSLLSDWRSAVLRSRAVADLTRVGRSGTLEVSRRAERLVVVEELWARSYAQFVATRCGDETLRGSVATLRRREPGGLYWPRQWDDDDFAEIEAAIESLFRRMRWIT